ncbi:MAG TPA: hypothetical protein VFH00_08820 [Candidatus Nitrosotalea sp.]|nr:hypothetical protein [Candidatus Nitrosotalea sp.]
MAVAIPLASYYDAPLGSLLPVLVVGITITIVWLLQSPIRVVYFLVASIFLQDPVLILVSIAVPGPAFTLIGTAVLAGKEVIVVACVIYLVASQTSKAPLKTPDLWALLYCAYAFLYLVLPNAWIGGVSVGVGAKIASASSAVILVACYMLGRFVPLSTHEVSRLVRTILTFGVASIVAGLAITALPGTWWSSLGFDRLLALREGALTSGANLSSGLGVPLSFYFLDLTPSIIPWPGIRRFSSTILDPISTGLVFGSLWLLALEGPVKVGRLIRYAFGAATILALGRGGLVLAVLGFTTMRLKRFYLSAAVAVGGLALALLIYISVLPQTAGVAGTANRWAALYTDIVQTVTHPLGAGLGTSGYLTVSLLGTDALATYAGLPSFTIESYIGTIGLQLGITGVLLYLGFTLSATRAAFRIMQSPSQTQVASGLALVAAGGMLALTCIGVISASGYGFTGAGISYLICGLAINLGTRESPRLSAAPVRLPVTN